MGILVLDAMAYGKFDGSNIVPLILVPVAAASELGVFMLGSGVNSLFDFSLSDTLFSLGSATDITISMIVFLASVGALVAQGQLDQSRFQKEEWYVIVGSFGALPAYQLIPAFGDFVNSTPIVAIVLCLGVSAASIYISYTG